MEQASEALFKLKPVTFRYKEELDPEHVPQFGLIAEEVEKVDPNLVVRDEAGNVTTVRYEAVSAMLLNEYLKEHHRVAEQQTTIAELKATVAEEQKEIVAQYATAAQQKKQIEALTVGLQRVTAQIAAATPTTRVVVEH